MSFVNAAVDDNGVATITLNDPERRNTISLQMNEELVEIMERLENTGAKAVIVTGEGKGFCAGADLGDLLLARERDNIHDIYRGFLRVAHSPLPTIAAVNGAAVGAGTQVTVENLLTGGEVNGNATMEAYLLGEDAVFFSDSAIGLRSQVAFSCRDSARFQRATKGPCQSTSGGGDHVIDGRRMRVVDIWVYIVMFCDSGRKHGIGHD